MTIFKKTAVLTAVCLLLLCPFYKMAFCSSDKMNVLEKISSALLKHDYEAVFLYFDDVLKADVPAGELAEIISDFENKNGVLDRVEQQWSLPIIKIRPGDISSELWSVRFLTVNKKPFDMLLAFDAKKSVIWIQFFDDPDTKAAGFKNVQYENKTRLSLPFQGKWSVIQGGFLKTENHHLNAGDGPNGSTFAYDFVMTKNGKAYHSSGNKLEDYYSYGQPVLAPADGKIVQIVDGIPDSLPGESNRFHPAGNIVVIDHGNSEYSLIAHLKLKSVVVKEGDTVKRGQIIGLCGNSGGTGFSVPHIHYQLMESPRVWNSFGIPAAFSNVELNGELKEKAYPRRGYIVGNSR